MIKNFILKSKKIYALLGGAMVICLCVLVFNAGVQAAEKPTEYSKEYLKMYGTFMWAFGDVGASQETANEWAINQCNLFVVNH